MDKQTGLAYLVLLLAQVFWGGAFVAAKIVVAQIDPQVAAAARFGLSFAVLMLFLVVFEKTPRPALRDWLMLAALGFTGIFLYQEFFFHGMRFAAATDGALMVASNPVFTMLLAGWFLQERVGTAQVGGLLLSVAGMLIIITKGSWEVLARHAFNPGDLLLLGCAAAWALYTVWGKKALDRFSPLALTTFASGFGALFLLAAAFSDLGRSPLWSLNPAGIGSLVFLGVLASGVANVFWYAGVRGVGAGRAAVFTNMVPFWSAVTAAVFLGEQLRLFHLAGAVLILGGVYLATRKGHPQEGRCGDDGRCRHATPGYK